MMAMEELMGVLKYVLLGVNALLFIALVVTFATTKSKPSGDAAAAGATTAPAASARKNALLVTAHPDDESMFFLPLLYSLVAPSTAKAPAGGEPPQQQQWNVHLLCLSRGNFDGLGEIRENELKKCGAFLGLASDAIHVVEDAKLQDGMQEQWSRDHIAQIVLQFMDTHSVDAVFTFDNYGVSGHANHIDTHYGVKRAVEEQHRRCYSNIEAANTTETTTTGPPAPVQEPVRGWALESTNMVRKYIGVLDAVVAGSGGSSPSSTFVFLFRPWWNYQAMALHSSQFVWFRRLFVAFSRYTYINTFTPLVVDTTPVNDSTKKSQ